MIIKLMKWSHAARTKVPHLLISICVKKNGPTQNRTAVSSTSRTCLSHWTMGPVQKASC